MKKLSKIMVLLFVVALLLAFFAGCSMQNSKDDVSNSQPSTSDSNSLGSNDKNGDTAEDVAEKGKLEPLTLPIVEEPLTITIWIPNWDPTSIKDFSEVEGLNEVSRRTNIYVEWQHPRADESATAQLNLILASGQYPDVIHYNWDSIPGGMDKLYQEGVIIELNELIENYAPNISKLLEEDPHWRKQMVNDEGKILGLTQYKPANDITNFYRGYIIRKDWLEKLGMQAPTTLDEWYEVLKNFKNNDMNGNGKQDEIPFLDRGNGLGQWATAFGVRTGIYPDAQTRKMVYGPLKPEFKDYLATMRKWYEEGLIDPEYRSNDGEAFKNKIMNHLAGSWWGTIGGDFGNYITAMKDDPTFKLEATVWPTGPAGKPYASFDNFIRTASAYRGVITTSCKYPKEVIKYFDYRYSDEGSELINWGIEGKSFIRKPDGTKELTDIILKNPEGLSPMEAMARFGLPHRGIEKKATDSPNLSSLPEQQKAYEAWSQCDTSLLVPVLSLTPEEASRYNTIMDEVNSYYGEMVHNFIMGVEPLDKYENFVETLKNMRVEEAVAIMQAAWERYQAR